MTRTSTRTDRTSAHGTRSGDDRPGRAWRLVTHVDDAVVGTAAFGLAVCRALVADLADLTGRTRRTRRGARRSWS